MMNKKLLLFDIDGTLAMLGDVKEATRMALKQAQANGHLVFICSGRTPGYQEHLFGDCADGFICNNGRYARYHNRVLFDLPIRKSELFTYIDYFETHHYAYLLNDLDKVYVGGFKPEQAEAIVQYHGKDEQIIFNYNRYQINVYNMDAFYHSEKELKQLVNDLKGRLIINAHGDNYSSDLSTCSFTKGDAVLKVCEALNIDYENTYAFGDGFNDLQMMKSVAHPIAMGNAVTLIKEHSEYISDECEALGVVKALKHYKLI